MALYSLMFRGDEAIRVPELVPELSTKRLLTMTWLEGQKLLAYKAQPLEERNVIARALFRAWWYPFSHYAVIHGDPHLGNYTIFEEGGRAAGINLLDYGCIRTFEPKFVGGVIDLYHGLQTKNRDLIVHAYETWGFCGLSNDLIDILNIWAGFIYGPLLEDRVRPIAEGIAPGEYGRARGLPRAPGPAREGAGEGAARVRVHGPRGGGLGRRVSASGGGAEFLSPFQRGDRGLQTLRYGGPAGRGVCNGRGSAAIQFRLAGAGGAVAKGARMTATARYERNHVRLGRFHIVMAAAWTVSSLHSPFTAAADAMENSVNPGHLSSILRGELIEQTGDTSVRVSREFLAHEGLLQCVERCRPSGSSWRC